MCIYCLGVNTYFFHLFSFYIFVIIHFTNVELGLELSYTIKLEKIENFIC